MDRILTDFLRGLEAPALTGPTKTLWTRALAAPDANRLAAPEEDRLAESEEERLLGGSGPTAAASAKRGDENGRVTGRAVCGQAGAPRSASESPAAGDGRDGGDGCLLAADLLRHSPPRHGLLEITPPGDGHVGGQRGAPAAAHMSGRASEIPPEGSRGTLDGTSERGHTDAPGAVRSSRGWFRAARTLLYRSVPCWAVLFSVGAPPAGEDGANT